QPRRARRDLPAVFEAGARGAAYPPRRLPLLHRQPPDGAQLPPRGSAERRWRHESPRRPSAADAAPRPEFALPDGAREEPPPPPAPCVLPAADRAPLRRKVLNTERYNNGDRWRAARCTRAAVRVLLAASGALYALAFLAFYFLSLP
ncbi:uncharacterized protein, partial [Maniola hyperantus]|uniref:uncharacterized protein n=1 Tax=Aphantopus hyperantus TaxID=2795564 RepID=UPI003748D753